MIAFQRILFPVDFSTQSRGAAPFVKIMATRFQAEVILLHAVEVPPAWYGPPDAGAFDALTDLSALLNERCETMRTFLAEELSGIRVSRKLEQGDPALLINQYARANKIDLIMMPTHGYGPFRSLLLGSVTAKVLHDAECPVWTGVHTEELAPHSNEPFRSILCAVHADLGDVRLVKWAASFACEQHAELRLVHAIPAPEVVACDGYMDPQMSEFLWKVAQEQVAKLQAEAGTNLQVCMHAGKAAYVVREAALHHQADLVVVGRGLMQKRLGRLRSNTYSIIREAPCPVISV